MIGRRGWRLWAVNLVGLLVMAVMVEETLELKLSHHLHGDMGESAEKNSIDYQLTIITINYIYQLLDINKTNKYVWIK